MGELPYPEVLPEIDPRWRTSDVLGVARGIYDDKAWERLPILADALMDAGCEDEVILEHLRGKRRPCPRCDGQRGHNFEGSWHKCDLCKETGFVLHDALHKNYRHEEAGCWQRQCWLVNHLLGETQPLRAIFRHRDSSNPDFHYATVINPGEWFGKAMVIWADGCFDPPMYVVEGAHLADCIDEFIESDYGEAERIDIEKDGHEWGFLNEGVWVDLHGNPSAVQLNPSAVQLIEPGVTGDGTYYDSESINGWEADQIRDLRYYGPGLPQTCVTPKQYSDGPMECEFCGKEFWPTTDTENVCCATCFIRAVQKETENHDRASGAFLADSAT